MQTKHQNQTNCCGFRQYEPQLGRWHVVDAMAEKYFSESPYNYVGNNPVSITDMLGLAKDFMQEYWDNKIAEATGTKILTLTGGGIRYTSIGYEYIKTGEIISWDIAEKYLRRDILYTIKNKDAVNNFMALLQNGLTFTSAEIDGKTFLFSSLGELGKFYIVSDGAYLNENSTAAVFLGSTSSNGNIYGFNDKSAGWFSNHQFEANVASGTLTFLSAAEHFAEVTDGQGSGAYFKVMGRIVFFVSAGYNAGVILNDVENNNYNHATKTGLDTYYSAIMTFGGPPGFVFGGIMMLLNNTVGIDNMIKTQGNIQIERADRMNRGDYSLWFWGPGTIR